MAYKNLRQFIEHLEKQGRLIRITEPVSTHLEMTAIGDKLLRENGPAVLLENVVIENEGRPVGRPSPEHASYENQEIFAEAKQKNTPSTQGGRENNSAVDKTVSKKSTMPVLLNLFGTIERVAWGMARKPEELRDVGKTLAFLRQPEPPGGWKEAIELLPVLKTAMAMKPKTLSQAPCQEVVLIGDAIDLGQFPIQTCWPEDAGPLITWPLVVTRGPGDKSEDNFNLGIYRMQVTGRNTTLMRWLKHRGGAQHHARWKREKSEPLPAAAVIGCDPATILAAVTPVPDTLSEYQFAGLLRGQKVELVDCKTVPLKVPAEAEIVLEGHVSLQDYGDEGPFGDHTGYYNSVEKFPVFTISAITMRKNPIYLTTHTGHPPDEPSVLGEALNEVFIPLLQQQFPEIVDFYLPPEGCSYRIAVVSIKKAYPGHAKRIMMGIWSYLRQFVYTKWVIVVDDDIDVRDWKQVMWAISTRMDPVRDTMLVDGTPIDYLDFASPEPSMGGKAGLDATNKIYPETSREWGKKIYMNQDVVDRVHKLLDQVALADKAKKTG